MKRTKEKRKDLHPLDENVEPLPPVAEAPLVNSSHGFVLPCGSGSHYRVVKATCKLRRDERHGHFSNHTWVLQDINLVGIWDCTS